MSTWLLRNTSPHVGRLCDNTSSISTNRITPITHTHTEQSWLVLHVLWYTQPSGNDVWYAGCVDRHASVHSTAGRLSTILHSHACVSKQPIRSSHPHIQHTYQWCTYSSTIDRRMRLYADALHFGGVVCLCLAQRLAVRVVLHLKLCKSNNE